MCVFGSGITHLSNFESFEILRSPYRPLLTGSKKDAKKTEDGEDQRSSDKNDREDVRGAFWAAALSILLSHPSSTILAGMNE